MKFNNPFSEEGKWFKGNLHTHTTNSDGTLSPEEIIKIYREHQYNFLFFTDHNKITDYKSPYNDFLTLKGVELIKNDFHILGLNINEVFNIEKLSVQEIINKIKNLGGFSILCHPYWSGLTSQQILIFENLLGIEIYNNSCEKEKGKGYSTVHWDEMLQNGFKTFGFAVDDCHYQLKPHKEHDICEGFIMVKAEILTEKNICNSIKNGLFYSSTGVLIKNIEIKNNKIMVEFTPALEINFVGDKWSGELFSGKGKDICYAEYTIHGGEKYIRIEITDKNNKKAWTNPIFLK